MNSRPEQPKYEERCVAFLDILGFERMVLGSSRDQDGFLRVGRILSDVQGLLLRADISHEVPGAEPARWRAHWFSDSIVLTGEPTGRGLRDILAEAHHLYGYLLQLRNCLLRGAVTSGAIYDQGAIIFGPALVEAFRLERDAAVYPRIILSDRIRQGYDIANLWHGDTRTRCFTVTSDGDGDAYIDPLRTQTSWPDREVTGFPSEEEWLGCFRAKAVAGMREHRDDPGRMPKYLWMARKLNERLTQLPGLGVEAIDLE